MILGVLLLLLLNGCSLFRQYGSIEGYVYVPDTVNKGAIIIRDSKQAPTGYKPLPGAKVSVQDFYKFVFTDINGYFLLEDVITGLVSLIIEPPINSGYNSLTTQVMVEPDTTVPIGTYGAVSLPSEDAGYWDITINQIDDSEYPEVKVYVSVLDPGNNIPMVGATSDNFELEIIKNFNEIKINNISVAQDPETTKYPASISLVIDRSGSMEGENYDDKPLEDAKTAAKTFVNLMSSSDRAEVISFANYVTVDQSFTSDKQALYNAIDSLQSDGATALYDAIWQGLDDTDLEVNSRKAVITLTDGGENCSSNNHGGGDYNFSYSYWLEYPDNSKLIYHAVQEVKIPIYTIGLAGFNFTREKVVRNYSTTEADLKEIADKTGGVYKYAATSEYLEYIYEEIKQHIEQQYIITFTDNTGVAEGYLTVKLNYNQLYGEDTKEYNPPAQEYENKVEVYGRTKLDVREPYGTDANVIGEKFWGSIGTVIDGPKEADGHTWLKVKWENDENVPGETDSYYKPVSGWSEADYLWDYDTDKSARGIDVSHWNSIESDGYDKIYNSGREFAFVKASEGLYTDLSPKTEDYLEGLKNAGLVVGVYHLGRPAHYPNGAYAEAEHFYKEAKNYIDKGYLRPALDLEQGEVNDFLDNYSVDQLIMWINYWAEKIQELSGLSEKPIIYISKTTADKLSESGDTSIKEYPLWIVDWSNSEDPPKYGWSKWSFRQYAGNEDAYLAGRGRCPGFAVDAGVDLNIYNGDIEDLKSNFLIQL